MSIDSLKATQINEAYYKKHVEVPFLTEAKGKRYPNAFAHFLYLIIGNYLIIDNRRGGTIKVVELGARGVYFEKEVYSNLRNIDKANNTNVAENIEYVVVDISPVAIEAASKQYKKDSSNLFTTRFVVADVLNKRELSNAGSNNFMVVLNELIDDLPQMVVTRKGNSYYEILYKPIFDPSYGRIRLTRNGFRKLSDEEANMLADYESRLNSDKLEEGYAITYSPVLDKLIENISMLLSPEGRIFVHDYFIRANIPLSFADNLRRIYGYNLGPSALYSIENNKVQITADVNLQQLGITLNQKGFEAQAMPHRFFINEYLGIKGIKELSLREIEESLNATPKEEKKLLLKKISKYMPVNKDASNIEKELLSALKIVFRGLELTDSHFYAQEDIVYRVDVIQDETKRKLANEIYKLCRKNYAVANPFMDVYAYRKSEA